MISVGPAGLSDSYNNYWDQVSCMIMSITNHTVPELGRGQGLGWVRCLPIFQVLKLSLGFRCPVPLQVSVKGFCIMSIPVPVPASVITPLKCGIKTVHSNNRKWRTHFEICGSFDCSKFNNEPGMNFCTSPFLNLKEIFQWNADNFFTLAIQ